MTNNQLNRERLEKIAAGRVDARRCNDDEIAMAITLLAAMDGEPVAWTWHYREQWHVTNDKCRAEFVATDGDVAVLPLYRHAQPVPVVSADLLHTAASAIEDLLEHTDPNTSYYSGVWADVPGKLRAAMLQAQSGEDGEPTDDERIMAIEGIHNCERCSDEGWVGEMGITRCACNQGNPVFKIDLNSDFIKHVKAVSEKVRSGNSPVIPDGYVMVPKVPSQAHLNSIAMRYRHDFYLLNDAQKDSALATARQMYEECSGQGFYTLPAAPQEVK